MACVKTKETIYAFITNLEDHNYHTLMTMVMPPSALLPVIGQGSTVPHTTSQSVAGFRGRMRRASSVTSHHLDQDRRSSNFRQNFLVVTIGLASLLILVSTHRSLDSTSLGGFSEQSLLFDSPSAMSARRVTGLAPDDSGTNSNKDKDENKQTTKTSQDEFQELRQRYPPSVWTLAGRNKDPEIVEWVRKNLSEERQQKAMQLCGKFLYSSLQRAIKVSHLGQETYVATGDIDSMWTRDSAVQMGIYMGRMVQEPWLRLIVEGAIRRQAFNTIQDPYANAYNREWVNPASLDFRSQAIGRGGWVGTRNYELDSGAYFFTQLWDYYVTNDLYRPESLLDDPLIFDAVNVMVDVWIVEQHHDELSPYRYLELSNQGKGSRTAYTGMSWSGFRPSDDKCYYGYHVPANIFAAAGLERVLEINKRVWMSDEFERKARKLLQDIEGGIRDHGTVKTKEGDQMYAYEVNGRGGALKDFDDANVPSLLSIPLLGWSGYNRTVYRTTRSRIMNPELNNRYHVGAKLVGQGSPHTPLGYVWPMSFAITALTAEGTKEEIAKSMLFELQQSLDAACNDAAHEGVSSSTGCPSFSRAWFEWSNALFVVLTETALGERCDAVGQNSVLQSMAYDPNKHGENPRFYENRFNTDPKIPNLYLGVQAQVPYVA